MGLRKLFGKEGLGFSDPKLLQRVKMEQQEIENRLKYLTQRQEVMQAQKRLN